MKKETEVKLKRLIELDVRIEKLKKYLKDAESSFHSFVPSLKEVNDRTGGDFKLDAAYREALNKLKHKVEHYLESIDGMFVDIHDAFRIHRVRECLKNYLHNLKTRLDIRYQLDSNDFRTGNAGFSKIKEELDKIVEGFRQEYLKRIPEFIEKYEQELEELISNKTITKTEIITVGPYDRILEFYQFERLSHVKFSKTWHKDLLIEITLLTQGEILLEIFKDSVCQVSMILEESELITGGFAEILAVIGDDVLGLSTAKAILIQYSKFNLGKRLGQELSKF